MVHMATSRFGADGIMHGKGGYGAPRSSSVLDVVLPSSKAIGRGSLVFFFSLSLRKLLMLDSIPAEWMLRPEYTRVDSE